MAKMEIDLGPMMREAMIASVAGLVDAVPQYRFAVILELLRTDSLSRVMIMEALGERALLERAIDEQNQKNVDAGMPADSYSEKSWDDIARLVIDELKETPGGRAECV